MKILYIYSAKSGEDRGAWSGTVFRTLRALRSAGHQVDYLYALRDYKPTIIDKAICTYWIRIPALLKRQTRMDESFFSVRIFRQTLGSFDYTPYDIVFVPTNIAIVNALPRKIKPKIVHLVDATVDSLFNYYTEFSNLMWHNYIEGHILGKRAFRRADLIIASSDWCRQNSISQYGIDPAKIAVVEFGANLEARDIPAILKKIDGKNTLNIYWSGVNWIRKGGDIALDACKHLLSKGIDLELHITGMRELPSEIASLPFVRNHGFLDKNNPEEYRRLVEIMSAQDIFLFPSKAECSSIALCEANGFGLPCFVYDTGGTANYVENGKNGYMLPIESDGADFAERISRSLADREMDRLSLGAASVYATKLNWISWINKVNNHLTRLVLKDQRTGSR